MSAVSVRWRELIEKTSWCWLLEVTFPPVDVHIKHDIGAEIAHCKANLTSSGECDLRVSLNSPFAKYVDGVLPGSSRVSRLTLHALAMFRPYAHRIISLCIAAWSQEAEYIIKDLLKTFVPLSRLRSFTLCDLNGGWLDAEPAIDLELAGRSSLFVPFQNNDSVESILSAVTSYETFFPSANAKFLTNLIVLDADLRGIDSITLSSIEETLSQLASLELLYLDLRGDAVDRSSQQVSHKKPSNLNRLRNLDITINHSRMFWSLLSRLNLPKLNILKIFGGSVHQLNDGFRPDTNPAQPIRFPSLENLEFIYFPSHASTPLGYIEAPLLKNIHYQVNYWPWLVQSHQERDAFPPLLTPTSSELNLLSCTSGRKGFPDMIFLLAQHNLARTHLISLSGSYSGPEDSEQSDGDGEPQCETISVATDFSMWINDRLSDTNQAVVQSRYPVSPAVQLRKLKVANLDCVHALLIMVSYLDPSPRLDTMVLSDFRGCDLHCNIQGLDTNYHRIAFSNIACLAVDTLSLKYSNVSPAIHLISAFPNLQVLVINFTCGDGQCPVHPTALREHQEYVEYRDIVASLPRLNQLFIGLHTRHVDGSDVISFHPDLRKISHKLTHTVRRIIHSRHRWGLSPIPEIYLTLHDWRRHTWRKDPPVITARLR